MKKRICLLIAALMLLSAAAAACSRKDYHPISGSINGLAESASHFAGQFDAQPADAMQNEAMPSEAQQVSALASRKIIRDASLRVQTLEFDKLLDAVNKKTADLGGYIESNSTSGKGYYSSSLREANVVVRIPSEKLDGFLSEIDGLCNVLNRSENVLDVTDSYSDVEARIASLRTEYETLLKLLEKADNLDSIIALQDRLTDVRYEIEAYESRKRNLDSRIDYSTVTLNIEEVERETVVKSESFGEEVSRRFKQSLADVGAGLRSFFAWLFGELPSILATLLIIAIIIFIPVFIIVKLTKKDARPHKRKKDKTENDGISE